MTHSGNHPTSETVHKHTSPPVIDYEGSDYQQAFWEQGGREYEDRAEAIALKRLLPEKGECLLELGAGAGRNTPRYHGFDKIVLLDYSLTQLQQAQSRLGKHPRYIYVAADVYRLPFVSGLFDTATMIRVLHHIVDVPGALTQIRRVLQPDGIFILEYANKRNVKAILRYMLHKQSWSPFSQEPVEFVELNFDFHPRKIIQWLQEADFKTEQQLTVSHFRMSFLKKHVPLELLVTMDALAQKTGNLWQLSPSVFARNRVIHGGVKAAPGDFFFCPECAGSALVEQDEQITCPACGKRWQIRDGIYDFREPLDD